jgi:uroporphyrinogen decarboxylase
LWIYNERRRFMGPKRRKGTPFVSAVSCRLSGTTIKENVLAGETQFKTISAAVEEFDLDTVPLVYSDSSFLAEACGCEVKITENDIPSVVTHPIKTLDDIARLKIPDPTKDGRIPEFLKAARLLSERYPNRSRSAMSIAPFTFAGQLAGIEYLSKMTIKNAEFVRKLLDFCLEATIVLSEAFINAGATSIFLGDPMAGLLSKKAYAEFAGHYTKKFVDRMKVPVSLHICGNTTHIIEEMCATGVRAISVDSPVDLPSIVPRVPPHILIIGNLSPVGVLRTGTPEEVARATKELMDKMKEVPNYMVATGCDCAYDTPLENIKAMMDSVKNYQ